MKHTLIVLAALFVVTSCKQTPQGSKEEQQPQTEKASDQEQTTTENNYTIYMSTDTGTKEFLKLVEEKGKRMWYYWSEKNEEEVLLGTKTVDGLEALYFFGKPNELYEIGGSECGFSLFLGEKRLQWYDQIEPECDMNYE